MGLMSVHSPMAWIHLRNDTRSLKRFALLRCTSLSPTSVGHCYQHPLKHGVCCVWHCFILLFSSPSIPWTFYCSSLACVRSSMTRRRPSEWLQTVGLRAHMLKCVVWRLDFVPFILFAKSTTAMCY